MIKKRKIARFGSSTLLCMPSTSSGWSLLAGTLVTASFWFVRMRRLSVLARQTTGAKTKRIRAITFDLDNTLWDTMQVIGAANEAFFGFISTNFPTIASKYSPEAFRVLMSGLRESEPSI